MDQNPAQPLAPQSTDQSTQTPQPPVPPVPEPTPASQPAPSEPAPSQPQPEPAPVVPQPPAPEPAPVQPQPTEQPAPQPVPPAPEPAPAAPASQPAPSEPAPSQPQPEPAPAAPAPQPAEQPAQPSPANAPAAENLQSTVSAPGAPAPEHHAGGPSSKIFTIILVLIVLAGLGYGGYLYAVTHGMTKAPQTTATTHNIVKKVAPTATPTPDATASWQTYENTKYAYSVKYPTGLTPHEVTTPYSYVEFKNASSSGTLPPYMVSVIPATFTAKNLAAYNYMSSDWINSLSSLKTGDSATSSGTTFTRRMDMTVNGQNAVSVNVVATGTKQERVYVKANGNIYVLSNFSPASSESAMQDFNLFVSSFKLTK